MSKKTSISLTVLILLALLIAVYFVSQGLRKSPAGTPAANQEQLLLEQRLSEAQAIKAELTGPKSNDLSSIKDPEQRKKAENFLRWYNNKN